MGYWESSLHKSLRSRNDNSTRSRAKDNYTQNFLKGGIKENCLNENPGLELTLEEKIRLEKKSKKDLEKIRLYNEVVPIYVFFFTIVFVAILMYWIMN
jgi:hypothetical protein